MSVRPANEKPESIEPDAKPDAQSRAQSDAEEQQLELNRDTVPGGINLRQTLPTGASFHATWKMPAWLPSAAVSGNQESGTSGVRRLDIADDTTASHTSVPSGARVDLTEQPSLGRTMRMELGLPHSTPPAGAQSSSGPRNDPRDTLEPTAPISPTRKAAFAKSGDAVLAASVQRIGEYLAEERDENGRQVSQRPTDPFGQPAQARTQARTEQDTDATEDEQPSVVNAPPPSAATVSGSTGASTGVDNDTRPWGKVRPRYEYQADYQADYPDAQPRWLGWFAERFGKPSRTKRFLLIAIGVAATVGTLLMLFAPDLMVVQDEENVATNENGVDSVPIKAEPHVVTPAPLPNAPAAAAASGTARATVTATTELTSVPANAEILRAGAIVANTPARIARPSTEADFLVRLDGYEAQLVRIGPTSPEHLTVKLRSKEPSADVPPEPANKP